MDSWWQYIPIDVWFYVGLWLVVVLGETLHGEPLSRSSALTWIFAAGGVIGLVTVQWWANRVLPPGPFPGISIVATPILLGLGMEAMGRVQGRWGWRRRHLDTWYGGACFGLGLSLARVGGMVYLGTL